MANILYVVGALTGGTPTDANESSFYTWLTTDQGHTVTCRDDNNADKTATGFDLVIVSSNTSSSAAGGYGSVAVPVLNFAHATWDAEFNLFTGGSFATSGTASNLYDEAGTLIGAVYSVGSSMRYVRTSNLAGNYTVLHRWTEVFSDSVAAWFYPAGGTLADGVATAPANRMAAWPLNEAIPNLTTLGKTQLASLIDKTINGLGGGGATTYTAGPDQSNVEPWASVTLTGGVSSGADNGTWFQDANDAVQVTITGSSFTAPPTRDGALLHLRYGEISNYDEVIVTVLPATSAIFGADLSPVWVRTSIVTV